MLFEGTPDYPDKDRFWAVIAKYKVTILYTAPTAIRAFITAIALRRGTVISQAGSALTQRSTTLGQQQLQTSSQGGFGSSSFGSGKP